MKILVLNEELGIPTNEPFEVIRTKHFYVIDVDGAGEVLVDADDVEDLTQDDED